MKHTLLAKGIAVDAFGSVLGSSIAEHDWSGAAQDTAREDFRRSEIEAMNNDARVANALANSRPGWSDISGVETGGRTIAELYADTYGGEVINTSDRLRLSTGSESLPEFTDPRITRTRLLADEFNALASMQAWGQVLPFAPSQELDRASPFAPYHDKTERNLADVPSFAIGV